MGTYHNRKKEKHVIHFVPIKVVELIAKVIAQPIEPTKVPLRYPCVIYSKFEHLAFTNPQKMKFQNMFCTKPTITSIVVPTTSRLILYQLMYLALSAPKIQVEE
jgi:hypothetical protein